MAVEELMRNSLQICSSRIEVGREECAEFRIDKEGMQRHGQDEAGRVEEGVGIAVLQSFSQRTSSLTKKIGPASWYRMTVASVWVLSSVVDLREVPMRCLQMRGGAAGVFIARNECTSRAPDVEGGSRPPRVIRLTDHNRHPRRGAEAGGERPAVQATPFRLGT